MYGLKIYDVIPSCGEIRGRDCTTHRLDRDFHRSDRIMDHDAVKAARSELRCIARCSLDRALKLSECRSFWSTRRDAGAFQNALERGPFIFLSMLFGYHASETGSRKLERIDAEIEPLLRILGISRSLQSALSYTTFKADEPIPLAQQVMVQEALALASSVVSIPTIPDCSLCDNKATTKHAKQVISWGSSAAPFGCIPRDLLPPPLICRRWPQFLAAGVIGLAALRFAASHRDNVISLLSSVTEWTDLHLWGPLRTMCAELFFKKTASISDKGATADARSSLDRMLLDYSAQHGDSISTLGAENSAECGVMNLVSRHYEEEIKHPVRPVTNAAFRQAHRALPCTN